MIVTIEDLRTAARRRLPRPLFDYIDGGAEDERSLANNAAAFGRIEFCPNVLRDVSEIYQWNVQQALGIGRFELQTPQQ